MLHSKVGLLVLAAVFYSMVPLRSDGFMAEPKGAGLFEAARRNPRIESSQSSKKHFMPSNRRIRANVGFVHASQKTCTTLFWPDVENSTQVISFRSAYSMNCESSFPASTGSCHPIHRQNLNTIRGLARSYRRRPLVGLLARHPPSPPGSPSAGNFPPSFPPNSTSRMDCSTGCPLQKPTI